MENNFCPAEMANACCYELNGKDFGCDTLMLARSGDYLMFWKAWLNPDGTRRFYSEPEESYIQYQAIHKPDFYRPAYGQIFKVFDKYRIFSDGTMYLAPDGYGAFQTTDSPDAVLESGCDDYLLPF